MDEIQPASIKTFEDDSDKLLSAIQTANHIARGATHPGGMRALIELIEHEDGFKIKKNGADIDADEAKKALPPITAAAGVKVSGQLSNLKMRIEWKDLSIAVIAGEGDKPELSVRTNLDGATANARLEDLITKLSEKARPVAPAEGEQPQEGVNQAVPAQGADNSPVSFKANGRRYMTIPGLPGPIGLPSVDVFTGGVSFKYENAGMTQFSLTLGGDIDDVSSDILEKCNMLSSDQVPVDGGRDYMDLWKKWNLADTLLQTFGLDSLWGNLDKEREGGHLSRQVIRKHNDILKFAKELLLVPPVQEQPAQPPPQQQQQQDLQKAEIEKFDANIRAKLDELNLEEDENNVDDNLVDNYENDFVEPGDAAEKAEKADALKELAEEIRKQSDMFRSNASILFSLDLLRAAYLGDERLKEFLGGYSLPDNFSLPGEFAAPDTSAFAPGTSFGPQEMRSSSGGMDSTYENLRIENKELRGTINKMNEDELNRLRAELAKVKMERDAKEKELRAIDDNLKLSEKDMTDLSDVNSFLDSYTQNK
ncbi:MAG: hypothetical protein LBI81_03300 [Puniceicoccales bacterium]|nr:hypothetical protein [Puniceicoccales bacterium]